MTNLNDSLDDFFAGASSTPRQSIKPEITDNLHWEPCAKCRGTGQTPWGMCFRCKGSKGKAYRTSASERRAARDAAHARQANREAGYWHALCEAFPDVAQWIETKRSNGNSFAESLREKVNRYGSLTDGQIEAVKRCIARDQERAQERVARVENAPAVEVDLMKAAFDKAAQAGLKRIKAAIAGYTFVPAGAASKNPGAIYVKRGDEYLGKVAGGKFLAMRSVDQATSAQVVEIISDPKAAARASGLRTGRCSCCGRELTDPDSIRDGIGPICATKFGW